ncbi:uncharacterized protein LOC141631281 [Silene latifolia]|uniref:uncharacterized protein LOC141631281 n=1 Tax=Silene latifolia TaxID=37657 RepID=UPI003D779A8F
MELRYVTDSVDNGGVVIDEADIEGELAYWSNTLVGQFLGGKPSLVQGSTWSLGNHSLVMKRWTPQISKELDSVSRVPVWVTLPDLDAIFWSEKALSKIATKIGTPMYADPVTTNKERLSFARLMIEVDVLQRVVFEWLPYCCTHCKKLGHDVKQCRFLKKPAKEPVVVDPITTPTASPAAEVHTIDSVTEASAVEVHDPATAAVVPVITRERSKKASTQSVTPTEGVLILQKYKVVPILNVVDNKRVEVQLWVIWNKASLVVTALSSGVQWVHLQVEAPGCVTYQVTFVYGLNSLEGRVDLWTFIKGVKPTCPWVCLGDFNCVRSLDERISNTAANLQALADFNYAITMAGLEDMVTHGFTFTWTNKQEDGERKWMKLDRVLINTEWAAVFSHSYADSLVAGVSDHSPLVVSIPSTEVPRPKQFRFLNCWAQDPSFPDIVKEVW